MRTTHAALLAAAVFVAATSSASAARKAGLWEYTVKIDIAGLPPGLLEQMKQAGIENPTSKPITGQMCVTPEMAARDDVPIQNRQRDNCSVENLNKSADSMSADIVCKGDMKGKGSIQFSMHGDDTYTGFMDFKGTDQSGRPISTHSNYSGRWIASDCGSVKPPEMPKP